MLDGLSTYGSMQVKGLGVKEDFNMLCMDRTYEHDANPGQI